ncbi:hypothetical protein ABVT39_008683 [Epinephelus coioides]
MQRDGVFRRNRRTVRKRPRVRPLDAALMVWHRLRNQVQDLPNLLDEQKQEFFDEKKTT